ncbi:quinohemoprotein amine dehydrogenase subunit beta [Aromatoleum bremense]|uniref:Quinohemoprotein amine dehydrogenase subunit beta n=1 Tax=Aromatoleum bremense TaxID=76115 RepID=A0ABX1NT17_9RHOO|nr:quinohemoprotein amine dehydrogenase subunit beta [Aromatoleum bremense]NMG14687.1 quinohemoprotein amine dehydrogenase subunit beta [Aromatoleum bremense]QTQ30465.1 Quinohemoprotein amine dehydrogenase, beta subunit [Aromatoleum bremense]
MKKLLVALCCVAASASAIAAEYLLTVTRPNTLHVIDPAKREVVRSVRIPGDGVPGTITVPKDGKVAYVLTNRMESVVGIDLDTGNQVFRADFSSPGKRIKGFFAAAVSEDGRELYVHQAPVVLGRSEYQVEDTYIAVFDTADGVGAKPRRTFPAPRRISLLAPTGNKDHLLALGWDMYLFNIRSGTIEKTYPIRHWDRPGLGEPDVLAMWGTFEQARALSTPYFVAKTDAAPDSAEAFKAGIAVFDLDAETLKTVEFENAQTAMFSSVINPVARNEAFLVMNQLSKVDTETGKLIKRVDLEQTFYAVNISGDGKEVYVGGALDKIVIHDAETLEKTGEIMMPGGADQSIGWLRVVRR